MLSDKQIEELDGFIKERTGKKRYVHSVNVAYEALKLARTYGVDENRAFIAGYLHDCAKEMDIDRQRELIEQSLFPVDDIEKTAPALFHAIAGAVVAHKELGIEDMGVLEAIRYHTVGAPNMSGLGQVLYLADLISADRDYKDVKKMRKIAYESLNGAMLEALKFSVSDSVKKENAIPASTILAYNEYVQTKNEKREND